MQNSPNSTTSAMDPILRVEGIYKSFTSEGFLKRKPIYALENISFNLYANQTIAIVGKNSAGKSLLAKILVGLIPPSKGSIFFNYQALKYGDYEFRAKHIRMIFQDPNQMLNHRLTIRQILEQPLRLLTDLEGKERFNLIVKTLSLVGFYPEQADIALNSLSIGQKQRLALARAIIINPEVIIIDDALVNLDTTVKIKLINLLLKIQKQFGTSYIYIGKNLGIIKHIADKVMVMDSGKIIEKNDIKSFLTNPQTDISQKLVTAEFGKILTEDSWK